MFFRDMLGAVEGGESKTVPFIIARKKERSHTCSKDCRVGAIKTEGQQKKKGTAPPALYEQKDDSDYGRHRGKKENFFIDRREEEKHCPRGKGGGVPSGGEKKADKVAKGCGSGEKRSERKKGRELLVKGKTLPPKEKIFLPPGPRGKKQGIGGKRVPYRGCKKVGWEGTPSC